MEKQIYSISYNGLDKESRIDCLAYIRSLKNPTGSTCLDTEGLCRSSRSTEQDALANGKELEPGKFFKIDKLEF